MLKNTDVQPMKPRTISKIVIDSFMTVLLMALMGRQFWGDVAHEWIGTGMFALFIAHHVLNLNWYKTMFKGKYTPYRILQLIIDLLVFVAMIGLMVSGIMLSQHVFAFFPISGGTSFARILHMLASYWGFVLMALHWGLHWNIFISMTRTATKTPKSPPIHTALLSVVGIVIAAYGFYVFINRELLSNMLLQTLFVFLDYDESRTLFYLDYFAMLVFFVLMAQNVAQLVRKRASSKKKGQRTGDINQAVWMKNPMKKTLLFILAVPMVWLSLNAYSKNAPGSEMSPNNVSNLPGNGVSTVLENEVANVPETPAAMDAGTPKPNITETEPNDVNAPDSPVAMDTSTSKLNITEIEVPEDFVLIKGGTFNMGSPDSEAWRGEDENEHSVTVSDFYMSIYEVTQEEYQEIMGSNPSTFSGENLPVENITWFEAIAYCNARSEAEGLTPVYMVDGQHVSWNRSANGYRLPTEAEWEYAVRAGTATPFNTQTSISAEEANYYGHYPYEIENNYFSQGNLETKPGQYRETTIAVGSFSPNGWGLYDMHGNVGEWCWDYYGAYSAESQSDPTGPASGSLRVNRGGGWNDFAKHLRSAYRSSTPANNSSYNLGLRLVLGTPTAAGNVTDTADAVNVESGSGKVLIVYFSWSGNTRGIAHQIQEMTGADIFEIELVTPYSSDYNTVLDQAQRDQNVQARPELANHVENMEQYGTIILGYPNWWASIPMPIASFLEAHDFAGKTILPFCSHGGGRFGQSLTAIAKLVPDATLAEALSVHYSGGPSLPDEILTWLSQNGIIE
jgi:formylglycine-generating enzyme required for sulfatase activity/flavodoxin